MSYFILTPPSIMLRVRDMMEMVCDSSDPFVSRSAQHEPVNSSSLIHVGPNVLGGHMQFFISKQPLWRNRSGSPPPRRSGERGHLLQMRLSKRQQQTRWMGINPEEHPAVDHSLSVHM